MPCSMARPQRTLKGKTNYCTTTSAKINFENSFQNVTSCDVNACFFHFNRFVSGAVIVLQENAFLKMMTVNKLITVVASRGQSPRLMTV